MDQKPVSFSTGEPRFATRNGEPWWGAEQAVRDAAVRCEGNPDAMSLTLVLVAQTFVFAHQIGGTDAELRLLVKGYLT